MLLPQNFPIVTPIIRGYVESRSVGFTYNAAGSTVMPGVFSSPLVNAPGRSRPCYTTLEATARTIFAIYCEYAHDQRNVHASTSSLSAPAAPGPDNPSFLLTVPRRTGAPPPPTSLLLFSSIQFIIV